jgi:hypothetical protein
MRNVILLALVLIGCLLAQTAQADPCWCWDGEQTPFAVTYFVGTWNGRACVDTKFHSTVRYSGQKYYTELVSLVHSREFHEARSASCPLEE